LHPILGTIPISDGTGLVVADIPGIIQGASEGLGLGLDFLRHIERTRMLVFVLELSPADPSFPAVTYQQLLTEIRAYDPEILTRPALIVLNKLDLLQEGDLEIILEEFIRETGVEQDQIHAVSALQGRNVPQLRETLIRSSGTLTQDQIAGDEERLS
ncbi:MAG TPA: 50S ribosome-binding GTPase, partial [bacterium]|nr:50S ribosome-binding GTPase [bacterium]